MPGLVAAREISRVPGWCGAAAATVGSMRCGAVFFHQSLGLVLDLDCDLGDGCGVKAGVVGAECQFTGRENHADVCLRAAAITAIGGGQRRGGRCGHGTMKPLTGPLMVMGSLSA